MNPSMRTDRPITLVCFALNEEAAPFRKIFKGSPSVRVLVTGMGKANTERAVRSFLNTQLPGLVLTCGFAGGLDPALQLNDVLYEADAASGLVNSLQASGAKPGNFFCASRVIITPGEKRELREKNHADAVEMESGHIRALCREQGIPCATIRVVSDTAEEELPIDFNKITTVDQTINYAKLALALVKSPGKIPALLAMRKRTVAAAEALARLLTAVLQASSAK